MPGSVLVLGYGPAAKSYVATSYPHRILEAEEGDYRKIEWSDNIPPSLLQFLEEFQRDEKSDGEPRYIMNFASFSPAGDPEWNETTAEDPQGGLWFVYHWIGRGALCAWNLTLPPGTLSTLASEFRSGNLSHVAFGPTKSSEPDCIFLRNTGGDERWQYQWYGLPFYCERDVQRHIEGGRALSGLEGKAEKYNGANTWMGGRLRGVTFGPDGNYIVYRGENYDWEGAFPKDLVEALRLGRGRWSINNCILNPRNPNEYVLAFNEADDILRVYYAVHESFAPKFDEVIQEWAKRKGYEVQISGNQLNEAQCRHDLPPLSVPRSTSRPRSAYVDVRKSKKTPYAPSTVTANRLSYEASITTFNTAAQHQPYDRYQPRQQEQYGGYYGPARKQPDADFTPDGGPVEPTEEAPQKNSADYNPRSFTPDRAYTQPMQPTQPMHPMQPYQYIENYHAGPVVDQGKKKKKNPWYGRLSGGSSG